MAPKEIIRRLWKNEQAVTFISSMLLILSLFLAPRFFVWLFGIGQAFVDFADRYWGAIFASFLTAWAILSYAREEKSKRARRKSRNPDK